MLIDTGSKNPWNPNQATKPGGSTYAAPVAPTTTTTPPVFTPGYTPDYQNLVANDPGYLNWQNNSRLDLNQASAQRRETLRRMAIQYGGIAPGTKDIYGDIDQGTLDLAQKNEYSDSNRLKRSYEQSLEAFKRALSARGGLQSGELGYGLHQGQVMQGEREYDLGNSFANAAQQAVNNYTGVESNIRRGEYDALRSAQQSVFSNPAYQPTEGSWSPEVVTEAPSSLWTDQAVSGVGYTRDPVTGQILYGGVRRADQESGLY